MINLFKASLYKLFREKTFLITMIIGTGLAIFIPLLYKIISMTIDAESISLVSGQNMLLNSVSTGNNFGLTVPINLSVLVVAEFTTGSLRNKIIAGYRKGLIYATLLLSGIIFTFIMMVYYVGLSVLMGTIFGGFDASKIGGADFIVPFIFTTISSYIFVATFSVLVASNIRNIGGSLPILIIVLTFLNIIPVFVQLSTELGAGNENTLLIWSWALPTFVLSLSSGSLGGLLSTTNFSDGIKIAGIISPLIYSTIFAVLGTIFFKIRDVK